MTRRSGITLIEVLVAIVIRYLQGFLDAVGSFAIGAENFSRKLLYDEMLEMARAGAKVGLIDADIYGPSIPMMFGMMWRTMIRRDDEWWRTDQSVR